MGINKWQKKPLKSLCTRIGDGLHGTPTYDENSEFYFINGNNLKNGKIEITNNTNTVTKEDFKKNFIPLNQNTLLLSINGTLGSMAFYNNEKIMLGKSAAYINFKEDINKFYYYYFQLKEIQEYFHNVATGSTIKNLSLKSIQDFEVPIPDKIELENISNVLSSLDSKIELNNKINKELEAMAKTLYDYWFVQFDFPDENRKPYKSSGGKMVYNEGLKREIPEGWNLIYLDDTLEFEKGIEPGSDNYVETQINENYLKFFKVGDMDGTSCEWINKNICGFNLCQENDILVSFDGSVGKVAIGLKGSYSSGIRKIYQKDLFFPKSYIYMLFKSEEINKTILRYATGSNILHASSSIKNLKIAYNKDIVKKYNQICQSNFERIISNLKQNQELAKLRDWLLPMLMNGQVKVK